MDIENMDWIELFATADNIGDKYLTEDEIANREAELLKVRIALWNSLTDEDLDWID